MKTRFIPFALLMLLAQSSFSQKLHIGAKAGANINKLTGQSFSSQFSFGYHIGGFAEIKLTKKLSLQPEVLFNQVNIDTASSFSTIYQFNKVDQVKLKYITIPLLLSYKPVKNLAIQAGPQYGILADQNKNLLQNGKDAFAKGDFSLLAGVQVQWSNIRLYGRYAIGLNNLNDIDNRDQWKSQTIQLGLGITIF